MPTTVTAATITTTGTAGRAADPVLDAGWQVNPRVSVRPESFGALLYHFGTRRLSFLKDPRLLQVVQALPAHPDARSACAAAGLAPGELPTYARALDTLAATDMIVPRAAAGPR